MRKQTEYDDVVIKRYGCYFCCCLSIAEQIVQKSIESLKENIPEVKFFGDISKKAIFRDSEVYKIKETLESINSPLGGGKVIKKNMTMRDPEYAINHSVKFLTKRITAELSVVPSLIEKYSEGANGFSHIGLTEKVKEWLLVHLRAVKQIGSDNGRTVAFWAGGTLKSAGGSSYSNCYLVDKMVTPYGNHFILTQGKGLQTEYNPDPDVEMISLDSRILYQLV